MHEDNAQSYGNIGASIKGGSPPLMYTEPDKLRGEAKHRAEYYAAQEEKLEFELARIREMKRACLAMLKSFEQDQMPEQVPSRRGVEPIGPDY